ncbi:MAG: helix-turn-helix domain-containing protein [Rhizobiaceae bacterium]|nr:helix-turn-helix domain-containing protein [Rhizobiaceae bacterium]
MNEQTSNIRKSEIGERLKSLHPGVSRLQFAKELGVSDSTLGNYERGDRTPDVEFLVRLRERFGIDIHWLLTGEEKQGSTQLVVRSEGDFVTLPRYEARASAGGGLIPKQDISEYFSVGRDWLRRNLPAWAPPNALVGILEGSGDSMEPTIRDGDVLMIVQDVEWRIVERGGVFVFSLDDERLLLKRLQVLISGDLKIISDNPAYAPELIPFADIEHRIRIHGMVFFAGGKPRPLAR